MNFNELEIIDPILKAIENVGYETPSPIQAKAIPLMLAGKDILGCAQTGTGKTAAFAIPILQMLHNQLQISNKKRNPGALILTPTRELAIQISESFNAYGKYTKLKTSVVFGGVSQKPQVMALENGVDILVATPGRLNDLLNQKLCDLSEVSMLVLDEADRMLDMGFVHDVKKIIAQLPAKRQTLLFSATMPKEIAALATSILHHPVTVTVTPFSSTAEMIDQFVYFVDKVNKGRLLIKLLRDEKITSALVFSRTKHGANKIQKLLDTAGVKAKAIHGNKSQGARQEALSEFKTGEIKVLVATDIAARGIDINQLSHVINYDVPNTPETYVHRIGRTGRAGCTGIAISLCDFDEKAYLNDIQKLIKKDVAVVDNHPYPMQIFEHVEPKTMPRQPRKARRSETESGNLKSQPNNAKTPNGGRKAKSSNNQRKNPNNYNRFASKKKGDI